MLARINTTVVFLELYICIFLPKCIWEGVIFNLLCGVCLIVFIANWTLSSKVRPSAIFALVIDLIVRITRSTKPVPVCKLGVHLIRLILRPSQIV